MVKRITRAMLNERAKGMTSHSEHKQQAHFGGVAYSGVNRWWRRIACLAGFVCSILLCGSIAHGALRAPGQSCDTLELNALDSIDSFDQAPDDVIPATRLSSKFRYSDGLPKDFREICKQYKLRFRLGEHFELLYPELLYPFGDENRKSYLSQNLGMLRGRIRHKSGKWEVYTSIEPLPKAYIGKPKSWEKLHDRMASYIARNFSWGNRHTAITVQETADLLMLIRKHPDEQARKYFNAQELYSIPLNFGRERLGEGFHCGKMYWIYKEGQMFSIFIMSAEPAPVDCDKYLAELDGMFRF